MRRFPFVSLLAAALLGSSAAHASGALVVMPGASLAVKEVRAAYAQGSTETTVWVQLRLEGTAEDALWLVPIPEDASVDVAATAFLDALEDATAPRVAPLDDPPADRKCALPLAPAAITTRDFPGAAPITSVAVVDDALGYAASAGFDTTDMPGEASGARAIAVRLAPHAPITSTPPIRIVAKDPPPIAGSWMTPNPLGTTLVKTWEIGAGRAHVGAAGELVVSQSSIRWLDVDRTSYEGARAKLLASLPGAIVVESTDTGPLVASATVGTGSIPSVIEAYLARARDRGESSGNPSTEAFEDVAISPDVLPDGCPRGDLASSATCTPAHGPLDAGGIADDLAFAFAGPRERRLTRHVAIVPAAHRGRNLAITFGSGTTLPVVRDPARVWDALCGPPIASATPPASGQSSGNVSASGSTDPGASSSAGDEGSTDYSAELDVSTSSTDGACSGDSSGDGTGSDGCSGDSSGDSGGDSCSSSSAGSGESSGCSSTSGGGGDGCSSDGGGGGDGCSGGGGGEDCSLGRRRGRPRLSQAIFVLAAAALALRRARGRVQP